MPTQQATANRSPSVRYYHLDALRGGMMMWGILVHTSTLSYAGFFSWAAFTSGLVRMSAFFIVSGFLAYMLVERYGAKATILKRMFAVGVPFVTCLILLNPVTNWLIYRYHNDPIPLFEYLRTGGLPEARGPMVWSLHLWFLIVLLVYGLATPALQMCIDRLYSRFEISLSRARDWMLFPLMSVATAVACLLGRLFYEFVLEGILPRPLMFTVRATLYYLPFFVLGMALFRSKRMMAAFSRIQWFHLAFSGVCFWAVRAFFDYQSKWMAEALQILARAYVGLSLSSALFFLFGKLVPGKNTIALYLSDAAYSVYLFHYLVIYVLATSLRPLFGPGEPLLWAVALMALITTLSIHHFIILKSSVLRAIFNGKLSPAVKPASVATSERSCEFMKP